VVAGLDVPPNAAFDTRYEAKEAILRKNHRDWTVENWEKVIFFDETHFEVHGYRSNFVRR
jgi:hypothetical protein